MSSKRAKKLKDGQAFNTVSEDPNEPSKVENKPVLRRFQPITLKVNVKEEPKRVLPPVPFNVFKHASGIKWDQLGGFESWVKVQKMGPMTIPAWHQAFHDFMNRPIK